MRALTIKQPWAELIITGLKDVENRSQRTHYRGRFAVHAGLRRADLDDLDLDSMPKRLRQPIQDAWQRHDNPGRVLGTVELVDCLDNSPSPWAIAGYWHWILRDPRPYSRTVPAKGQLGLWEMAPPRRAPLIRPRTRPMIIDTAYDFRSDARGKIPTSSAPPFAATTNTCGAGPSPAARCSTWTPPHRSPTCTTAPTSANSGCAATP